MKNSSLPNTFAVQPSWLDHSRRLFLYWGLIRYLESDIWRSMLDAAISSALLTIDFIMTVAETGEVERMKIWGFRLHLPLLFLHSPMFLKKMIPACRVSFPVPADFAGFAICKPLFQSRPRLASSTPQQVAKNLLMSLRFADGSG